ncbi:MAG TPA: M3 family metallopeptidase [Kofleriaceae bacterium]|nr:M3 family metallopeptidase [Kofleriaceae bacterium]
MKKYRSSWLLSGALLAACGGKTPSAPLITQPAPAPDAPVIQPAEKEPPVTKPTEPKPPNPAQVAFATKCNAGLETAKGLLGTILTTTGPRTIANTLDVYNQLLTNLGNSSALAGLMSEVHPDEAIRDTARDCEQAVSQFATDLQLNRELFAAIKAVDVSKADAVTKRFVEQTLRDYRRSGVDRDDAQRARLKAIDDEMTRQGQQFSKNIAEDTRSIEVSSATELAGMPADFIAAHPPDANGKIHITTDYPDYNPFMTYAQNDALRKALYIQFRSRGDKQNEKILQTILELRAEKARILGYKNWADYITEDKMIRTGKAASDFITKIWKLAEPRAKHDYDELLKQLKTHDAKATAVGDWQKIWLEEEVKKAKYQVDGSEVRNYFVYQSVLAGLLEITSTIYGITYQVVDGKTADVWHPSVVAYDVLREGKKIGRIYLDMHPRDGKYKHAAQFTLRDGVAGAQLPEGALVCNFPDPQASSGPALMEHDDVVTMFHEFGHLMHHILGGNQHWVRHTGVATEWDFVEAPSQMFEEWAWQYPTLSRFAKHVTTGAVIPKELVAKMQRADKFGLGSAVAQQMFYASISLEFHQADPSKLQQLDTIKALQKKLTPYAYVDGTKFHASFGHLVGYSAMYYTYMWSKVIAKDLLSPFAKGGLMDTKVTAAYRDKILAAGGTKDAAVLVKDFLGRDYNFKAFEKYLSE